MNMKMTPKNELMNWKADGWVIKMEIINECPYCKYEQHIKQKDIKELTEKDKKNIKQRKKTLDTVKNETTKNIFGVKRYRFTESTRALLDFSDNAYGKVRCIVCKKESYLRGGE